MSFNCVSSTMKEELNGVLYHTAQVARRVITYMIYKRSLFRLLHLFLSRACKTDIYLFPKVKYYGMYDLLNLEITCFLKVGKVDKFLKSSSRPFHNLMDEGIHDFCKMLVLL